MRSISLAFACIAAVTCGSLLARFEAQTLLGPLVAILVAGAVGLAGLRRRERGRGDHWVLMALLACVGLVRGASVGGPEPARVHERGISAAGLRVFEVVEAGEPGPRCTMRLREGDSAATLTVSA